jgi:hypothetical protein
VAREGLRDKYRCQINQANQTQRESYR